MSDCIASKIIKYSGSKIIEDKLVKLGSQTKLSVNDRNESRRDIYLACSALFCSYNLSPE